MHCWETDEDEPAVVGKKRKGNNQDGLDLDGHTLQFSQGNEVAYRGCELICVPKADIDNPTTEKNKFFSNPEELTSFIRSTRHFEDMEVNTSYYVRVNDFPSKKYDDMGKSVSVYNSKTEHLVSVYLCSCSFII